MFIMLFFFLKRRIRKAKEYLLKNLFKETMRRIKVVTILISTTLATPRISIAILLGINLNLVSKRLYLASASETYC